MAFARLSAAAVCAVLVLPALLGAQYTEPPPPAAYAFEGVTVVRADGTRLERATVVVRNGLIESMGANVEVPADAERLEGDSLFLYPGLIDADGKVEYEFAEPEVDRSEIAAWNPPRHVQSFMPHRRVVDYLQATGKDVADQRQAGIVAAAVHPAGPLAPGRGVVVMMRANAQTPAQLVLRSVLGPTLSFQGSSGVYPRALFTVIAFYRQSFEDARHLAAHRQAYERGRSGAKPAPWDPDLAVLEDAMNGGPVYFRADRARDIQRALELGRAYGFRPLIMGGEEAWEVADELIAQRAPVLLSLDFPEPERWKPGESKPEEEEEQPPDDGGAGRQGQEASQEEPLSAGAQREKERIENAYANAGRLAAAGVTFALTSGGGEAELLEGARKAVEYGLSEDAALRALTVTPAALLGLEPLTRLEAGRGANFIVTDGPLFAEETTLRYTFVEGVLERAEAGGRKKAAEEEPTVDVTGTWEVTTRSPERTTTAEVVFEQSGSSLEGKYSSSFGETSIRDGVVSGATVSFSIQLEFGDNRVTFDFTGEAEGEEIEGKVESSFGDFDWSAKRISGPEGGSEND